MSFDLNCMMIRSCKSPWLFFNQLRMIDNYDINACSWHDLLINFCKSKMRNNSKQIVSTMIDEKNDKVVASFHCCIMIETNMTSLNRKFDSCHCMNDYLFWIIFNHWTYLFNQLQGRSSRSWCIQNVIELNCKVFEKSDPKKRWRIELRRFFTKQRKINNAKNIHTKNTTLIHH